MLKAWEEHCRQGTPICAPCALQLPSGSRIHQTATLHEYFTTYVKMFTLPLLVERWVFHPRWSEDVCRWKQLGTHGIVVGGSSKPALLWMCSTKCELPQCPWLHRTANCCENEAIFPSASSCPEFWHSFQPHWLSTLYCFPLGTGDGWASPMTRMDVPSSTTSAWLWWWPQVLACHQ